MGTRHYIRGRLGVSAKVTVENNALASTLSGNNGCSFFFKIGTMITSVIFHRDPGR